MSNPDLPPSEQPKSKLSPLAQTFQAIGHSSFKLGGDRPSVELNQRMWQAAANLTTSEYARARLVRLRWMGKTRQGVVQGRAGQAVNGMDVLLLAVMLVVAYIATEHKNGRN